VSSPLRIGQRAVGPLQVFTYLVQCEATGEAVIIDPGGAEEALARWAEAEGARVTLVCNTHGHGDHVAGNERLCGLLGVGCALLGEEVDFFRLERSLTCEVRRLRHGERVAVGEASLEVRHTPGHTPGGVCYHAPGHLFTGDTLFVGAVGRTDLQGSSMRALLDSIRREILSLDDETVVWPGHDYGDTPTSTVGRERAQNPFITDLILGRRS
jgi:hydroxyacylglutathione hydrolase